MLPLRTIAALTALFACSACLGQVPGYTLPDENLKAVLVDSSPDESFLSVAADTLGRLFVGGREALFVYEPKPDGKLELVGVEYITSKGPASLEGQLFSFTGAPNRSGIGPFYELHVWAWKTNPRGAFVDFNPHVSCEHAHGKEPGPAMRGKSAG